MSEVINIKELNERIERESVFVDTLRTEMGKVIVGQSHLVDTLLIGLLSNGHILLEGVPGLAKTLAITTLAKAVDAGFSRIQFTPCRLYTSPVAAPLQGLRGGRRRTVDLRVPRCQDREPPLLPEGFSRGTAERVDRLCVVAHHADLGVELRQEMCISDRG